jgi:hypothetical protein
LRWLYSECFPCMCVRHSDKCLHIYRCTTHKSITTDQWAL